MKKFFRLPQLLMLFRSNIFVYGVLIIVFFLLVDTNHLVERYRVRILNEIRPTFSELVEFTIDPHVLSDTEMVNIINYFEKVIAFVEVEPISYNLMGVFDYYRGNKDRALANFQKSRVLQPNFHMSFYNLAVLAYENKDYELAKNALEVIISQNKEDVIKSIYGSIVFNQIVLASHFPYKFEERIEEYKKKSFILLLNTYEQLKDYKTMFNVARFVMSKDFEFSNDALFMFYAAKARFLDGDYEQAAFLSREAINMGLQREDVYMQLGQALLKMGEKEQGESYVKRAIIFRMAQNDVKRFEDTIVVNAF